MRGCAFAPVSVHRLQLLGSGEERVGGLEQVDVADGQNIAGICRHLMNGLGCHAAGGLQGGDAVVHRPAGDDVVYAVEHEGNGYDVAPHLVT